MPAAGVARIVLTPGEPAGIGPDLAIALARKTFACELVCVADPRLLERRAHQLGERISVRTIDLDAPPQANELGKLAVLPVACRAPVVAGELNPANAAYVLETLELAAAACRGGTASAMVTGPVHKGVINDAGVPFSGHTEFLAELVGGEPVMLLVAGALRVALATTHLPLRDVADALDAQQLERTLVTLHESLRQRFGIAEPRISVCGLNPHAGESGHLGREEIELIEPVIAKLNERARLQLRGPLPADTVFTPTQLEQCDAVLAMYHDQGLPVLKHAGFGQAVNVTLGLPIVRTSVDHGTALDLAGRGTADAGSLLCAVELALTLASRAGEPGAR